MLQELRNCHTLFMACTQSRFAPRYTNQPQRSDRHIHSLGCEAESFLNRSTPPEVVILLTHRGRFFAEGAFQIFRLINVVEVIECGNCGVVKIFWESSGSRPYDSRGRLRPDMARL